MRVMSFRSFAIFGNLLSLCKPSECSYRGRVQEQYFTTYIQVRIIELLIQGLLSE